MRAHIHTHTPTHARIRSRTRAPRQNVVVCAYFRSKLLRFFLSTFCFDARWANKQSSLRFFFHFFFLFFFFYFVRSFFAISFSYCVGRFLFLTCFRLFTAKLERFAACRTESSQRQRRSEGKREKESLNSLCHASCLIPVSISIHHCIHRLCVFAVYPAALVIRSPEFPGLQFM